MQDEVYNNSERTGRHNVPLMIAILWTFIDIANTVTTRSPAFKISATKYPE